VELNEVVHDMFVLQGQLQRPCLSKSTVLFLDDVILMLVVKQDEMLNSRSVIRFKKDSAVSSVYTISLCKRALQLQSQGFPIHSLQNFLNITQLNTLRQHTYENLRNRKISFVVDKIIP